MFQARHNASEIRVYFANETPHAVTCRPVSVEELAPSVRLSRSCHQPQLPVPAALSFTVSCPRTVAILQIKLMITK